MNNKNIKELKDTLEHIYEYDSQDLDGKTNVELSAILKKEQLKAIRHKKNPNAFFIIKDLPSPKEFETKTSKKGGVLVFIAFIAVMLLFGAMMFWWAFR